MRRTQKAKSSGSSFYYSFIFLPAQKRDAITALYAFCREVDDVVDECSDYQVAKIKLAWWRNEIEGMYVNNPQHPVSKALISHIHTYGLAKAHFLSSAFLSIFK